MILTGACVMNEDFVLKKLEVEVCGSFFAGIGEELARENDEERIDVSGCYILPGFIDTHIHGAYGTRISDAKPDLRAMCRFEASQGVTGLAITTASSAFPDLLRQLELAADIAALEPYGAKIMGVHAEGPFISAQRKGAMNACNILEPDIEKFEQMQEKSKGLIKILTVAPEKDGAEELIRYAVSHGVTVSMGHTTATYEKALSGIKAGATQLTHTFNAMIGLNHREPGVLGAGLTDPDIVCEVICDYVHLHPAVVDMIYRVKGAGKINIISDSGHAAGIKATEFIVDGLTRYVKDGVVRLADGTIAGSAKTMLDGVKNLLASGIPLEDVSRMASLNPARTLKLDVVTGSIKVGKLADLVVLDKEYNPLYTFVNGCCVYDRKRANG